MGIACGFLFAAAWGLILVILGGPLKDVDSSAFLGMAGVSGLILCTPMWLLNDMTLQMESTFSLNYALGLFLGKGHFLLSMMPFRD